MYKYKHTLQLIIANQNAGGKAPESFVLFKAGWNELADGIRYYVDKESFDLIVAYWRRRGLDIVIDYEHQTLGGGEAPAAGWINPELTWDPARGIIASVKWNDKAAGRIAGDEYRYFSQVFDIRKADSKLVGLYSVALTNNPRTNNLEALAAKLDLINHRGKEESMEFFKQLFAKLGLADGADASAVMTAIDTLSAKAKEGKPVVAKDVIEALGLKEGDDVSTVVASINALKQQPKGMVNRQEFDAVVAKLAGRDADDAVAAALAAGKITPDQKSWADDYARRDLAGFNTFVAKAPVVIPTGKLPGQKHTQDVSVDETTLAVAKLFGNTAEDLKKYAPAEQA